jgi:RNA polymerase sigma factor (sigma-70 family)
MSSSPSNRIFSGEPVPLESVIATDRLISRPARKANRRAEREAFRELTDVLPLGRNETLNRLARLGLSLCDAGTAGVSLLESTPDGQVFRWQTLAGKLARYEGGATPRNWSPCGACLDAGKPILYACPARRFTYFNEIDTPIVEGLVIPIYAGGEAIGTIWIVSHDEERGFDAEDLRIMVSLAKFAGASLPSTASAATAQSTEPGLDADRETAWKNYMHRIARNDQFALNSLFQEARPLVFSIALRILSFAADADEIAGDVFARVWKSAYIYETTRGSAVGWITSITRHLAFDRLRSRVRNAQLLDALGIECGSVADTESRWLLAERALLLGKAMAALSFEQRRAIELAYFSGLSHAEIAKGLKQPLGTIKTRIRIGLIHLRSLLAAAQ